LEEKNGSFFSAHGRILNREKEKHDVHSSRSSVQIVLQYHQFNREFAAWFFFLSHEINFRWVVCLLLPQKEQKETQTEINSHLYFSFLMTTWYVQWKTKMDESERKFCLNSLASSSEQNLVVAARAEPKFQVIGVS
jgi:hypothetical protein